eukprot:5209208-Pyramimonas_sp.AAC.2
MAHEHQSRKGRENIPIAGTNCGRGERIYPYMQFESQALARKHALTPPFVLVSPLRVQLRACSDVHHPRKAQLTITSPIRYACLY